jgi:electron transport complex protein RnfC
VSALEIVAESTTTPSRFVRAPVSGKVIDVGANGLAKSDKSNSIVIAPDANAADPEPSLLDIKGPLGDLGPSRIETLIAIAARWNIPHPDTSAVDLADRLRLADDYDVRHVVINALTPVVQSNARGWLLNENVTRLVELSALLRVALGLKTVTLVVDKTDRKLLTSLNQASRGKPVRVRRVLNKYPQHHPRLLARTVLDRTVPLGQEPEAIGISVFDGWALTMLADMLTYESKQSDDAADPNPPWHVTHRLIELRGRSLSKPGYYVVPMGVSMLDILQVAQINRPVVRVVEGDALTGRALHSLEEAVGSNTSLIQVYDQDQERVAHPGPCVHCGWCQEDCPVGLNPQAILNTIESDREHKLATLHPEACIECGLCSYVCPTELPLTPGVLQAKRYRLSASR